MTRAIPRASRGGHRASLRAAARAHPQRRRRERLDAQSADRRAGPRQRRDRSRDRHVVRLDVRRNGAGRGDRGSRRARRVGAVAPPALRVPGVSARSFVANTVHYRARQGHRPRARRNWPPMCPGSAPSRSSTSSACRACRICSTFDPSGRARYLVPGTIAALTATRLRHAAAPRGRAVASRARPDHHVRTSACTSFVRSLPVTSGAGKPDRRSRSRRSPECRAARGQWLDGTTAHPGYFQLSAQPRASAPAVQSGPAVANRGGSRRRYRPSRSPASACPSAPGDRGTASRRARGRPAALPKAPWFDAIGEPFTIFSPRRRRDDVYARRARGNRHRQSRRCRVGPRCAARRRPGPTSGSPAARRPRCRARRRMRSGAASIRDRPGAGGAARRAARRMSKRCACPTGPASAGRDRAPDPR